MHLFTQHICSSKVFSVITISVYSGEHKKKNNNKKATWLTYTVRNRVWGAHVQSTEIQ